METDIEGTTFYRWVKTLDRTLYVTLRCASEGAGDCAGGGETFLCRKNLLMTVNCRTDILCEAGLILIKSSMLPHPFTDENYYDPFKLYRKNKYTVSVLNSLSETKPMSLRWSHKFVHSHPPVNFKHRLR